MEYININIDDSNEGLLIISLVEDRTRQVEILYDKDDIDFTKMSEEKLDKAAWRKGKYVAELHFKAGNGMETGMFRSEYQCCTEVITIASKILANELDKKVSHLFVYKD